MGYKIGASLLLPQGSLNRLTHKINHRAWTVCVCVCVLENWKKTEVLCSLISSFVFTSAHQLVFWCQEFLPECGFLLEVAHIFEWIHGLKLIATDWGFSSMKFFKKSQISSPFSFCRNRCPHEVFNILQAAISYSAHIMNQGMWLCHERLCHEMTF